MLFNMYIDGAWEKKGEQYNEVVNGVGWDEMNMCWNMHLPHRMEARERDNTE